MATPKNKKAYKYGSKKRVCFTTKRGGKVCFRGRERKATGRGGPPHGGTNCRTARGKFAKCRKTFGVRAKHKRR